MSSGYLVKRRFRRIGWVILAAGTLLAFLATVAAWNAASNRAYEQVRDGAEEALALQAETLNGLLEKYRLLPPLLARRDDIRAVFEAPWSGESRELAKQKATQIAGFSGARDVVFADARGQIFASARKLFDDSTIEQTELFDAARQGRLGRETRSSANGERNYVFASAISDDGTLLGVIAVYVLFDTIEATWSLTGIPIAATNSSGTVFLSNQREWQLRPLMADKDADDGVLIALEGRHDGVYREAKGDRLYLQARRSLPLLEWDLHVFENYRPVLVAGRNAALLAAGLVAFAMLIAWVLVKRRETLVSRMRKDQASALRLERLVRDRTVELTQSNASLAHEVDERTRAETRLRNTQHELVQAAKLAALGQMSAALSHEFNQPLAAIATQADNARRLIERDNKEPATEALTRISGLVNRMSELSRTLLTFARKPGTSVNPVSLRLVTDEALVLVAPRAKKAGVIIDHKAVDASHIVMGGRIRLTQVLINLINNAIDALSAKPANRKRIDIRAQPADGRIVLIVEDTGPGIGEEERAQIFDPFFTTKEVGEGLGIGLSVVFNIVRDFGGTIGVSNGSGGGARFEISLPAADIVADGQTSKAAAE